MANHVTFGANARAELIIGIDIAANAVSATLGPKGRNVIIEQSFGSPRITKDGVTVAKSIELQNKIQNIGAKIVKEAASKTNEIAGDGTTTASVITQAIAKEGIKAVAAGLNPMDLKRGIDQAVEVIVAEIKKKSKKVMESWIRFKKV